MICYEDKTKSEYYIFAEQSKKELKKSKKILAVPAGTARNLHVKIHIRHAAWRHSTWWHSLAHAAGTAGCNDIIDPEDHCSRFGSRA